MKICRDCAIEKEENLFIRNKLFKSGYDTLCKECNSKRVKQWRQENPHKRAKQQKREGQKDYTRNKFLKYNYGITLDKYNEMFANQQGCCAICNTHQLDLNRRLCVDHCHSSEKVRKLLCGHCNTLLGMAKDNQTILQAAILYLQETGY